MIVMDFTLFRLLNRQTNLQDTDLNVDLQIAHRFPLMLFCVCVCVSQSLYDFIFF